MFFTLVEIYIRLRREIKFMFIVGSVRSIDKDYKGPESDITKQENIGSYLDVDLAGLGTCRCGFGRIGNMFQYCILVYKCTK